MFNNIKYLIVFLNTLFLFNFYRLKIIILTFFLRDNILTSQCIEKYILFNIYLYDDS